MRTFEKQEFVRWHDRGGSLYEDMRFVNCWFRSCGISITRDPAQRTIVRNVELIKCEERGGAIDTAVLEGLLVDGLKTTGLLQTWGAVFKHVTLRGRIGRIMVSPAVGTGLATPEQQRAFDVANARYYADVDWALDIREAEFEECDIRRVPASLVRRDPETQVVVTRERALRGEWRRLDLSKTYWASAIEGFLHEGDADLVLVAGKRQRKFRDLVDGLKKLRDAGVAEPG